MTVKLYETDSYCRTFDSCVTSCEKNGDSYEVMLRETAFYPEGGGQPGDQGSLNLVPVLDTRENDRGIIHIISQAIPAGTNVHGRIDWNRRFRLSQQHSGEHIFSGIIHEMTGYDNVGFHMGSDYVTVDFSGILTREQTEEAERKANEAVVANSEIHIWYPSAEELSLLPYRSKKRIDGAVRLVEIPHADLCACCGTHVLRTGEIGIIKVTDAEQIRGGSRLTLQIGWQAVADYGRKHKAVRKISELLSVKMEETPHAVERLQENVNELRVRIGQLQEKLLESKAAAVNGPVAELVLWEEELSADETRRLCDMLMRKAEFAAVFSGVQESYCFTLGSMTEDVAAIGKKMCAQLGGKGGGKNTMFQGRIQAARSKIEKFLESRNHGLE